MASFKGYFKGYKRLVADLDDTDCDMYNKDKTIYLRELRHLHNSVLQNMDISKLELMKLLRELYRGNHPTTDLIGSDMIGHSARRMLLELLTATERKEYELTFHTLCGIISFIK
jgi:hypothetical protein